MTELSFEEFYKLLPKDMQFEVNQYAQTKFYSLIDDEFIKFLLDGIDKKTLISYVSKIYSIAFSPDGNYLASGFSDIVAKLWKVSDGSLVHTFTGHTQCITSVAFSPDGQYLASGSGNGTVNIYNIEFIKELNKLTPEKFELVEALTLAIETGGKIKPIKEQLETFQQFSKEMQLALQELKKID